MIDVSIIMPLYNAQKYLREAIESIKNQIFTNYELICINDCSTDKTGCILQKEAEDDKRIKLYNNPVRRGAAISRNIGINASRGKYLLFLDGDDIFDENLLAVAVDKIERGNADLVMYDCRHVNTEDIYVKQKITHGNEYKQKFCQNVFDISEMAPYEVLLFQPSTWNRLYRKKFIIENNIFFQNLESSNDVFFSYMSLLLSKKSIAVEDERIMVYARDHNELSRISKNRDPMCTYYAMEYLLQVLVQKKEISRVINHYFYIATYVLENTLLRNRQTVTEEKFYMYLQQKGISRLLTLAGNEYSHVDSYIENRVHKFLFESYQTRWYEEDNLLDIYLGKKTITVKNVMEKYSAIGKKIGVWGAGKNGKSFITFCNTHHIKLDMVVDSDIQKCGNNIEGYVIKESQEGLSEIDVFIITGVGIAEEVKKTIDKMKRNIELVDINILVGIY